VDAITTPQSVGVQDRFRVAERIPAAGALANFRANFKMVVDFAVKDDPIAGFGIGHRLMSRRTQIEDCQTRVGNRGQPVRLARCGNDLVAVIIRSAVFDPRDHAMDRCFYVRPWTFCVAANSRDAAHA